MTAARGAVFWAELETPIPAGSRIAVYWAEFETPTAPVASSPTLSEGITLTATESATRTIVPVVAKAVSDTATLTGTETVGNTPISTAPVITDWPALVVGGTFGVATDIDLQALTEGSDVAGFVSSAIAQGSAAPAVLAGLGGGVTVTTAIYRATRDNVWLEEISDRVEGGVVTVDLSQASPMTFGAQTIRPDVLTALRDWVAPVMTLTVPQADGSGIAQFTEQLGLYIVMPATKTYTAAQGMEAIDGRDALWLMGASGPGKAYSVAVGTNVGAAMRTVCDKAGVAHSVQTTSKVLTKKRTWRWNATWLQIFNDLARSIGFVPAWPDRQGRVRSHIFRRLGTVQPARTISSATGMVLDTVTLEPDMSRICNHVVVVGNDPKGNPVYARRRNTDPTSPTSAYVLGSRSDPVWISKFVEDPNLDDQEAVDALADRLMDQGSSAYVRMTVKTTPVLNWAINDVNTLDINTDDGTEVASGKWRWDRLTMGLGIEASCEWGMTKLLHWEDVA